MTDIVMHGPYPDEEKELNKPSGDRWGGEINEDNGTMVEGVNRLREAVVGHKIVKVEQNVSIKRPNGYSWNDNADVVLTLDNGKRVALIGESDCCAYGAIDKVIEKLPLMDHIITDVATSEIYTKWHILAMMDDVLELEVGWSPGNPFYYAYGINVQVIDLPDAEYVTK